MQFAQDVDWISKEVDAVWRRSRDEVQRSAGRSQHVADVERGLAMTKKLGVDWRTKQIVSHVMQDIGASGA